MADGYRGSRLGNIATAIKAAGDAATQIYGIREQSKASAKQAELKAYELGQKERLHVDRMEQDVAQHKEIMERFKISAMLGFAESRIKLKAAEAAEEFNKQDLQYKASTAALAAKKELRESYQYSAAHSWKSYQDWGLQHQEYTGRAMAELTSYLEHNIDTTDKDLYADQATQGGGVEKILQSQNVGLVKIKNYLMETVYSKLPQATKKYYKNSASIFMQSMLYEVFRHTVEGATAAGIEGPNRQHILSEDAIEEYIRFMFADIIRPSEDNDKYAERLRNSEISFYGMAKAVAASARATMDGMHAGIQQREAMHNVEASQAVINTGMFLGADVDAAGNFIPVERVGAKAIMMHETERQASIKRFGGMSIRDQAGLQGLGVIFDDPFLVRRLKDWATSSSGVPTVEELEAKGSQGSNWP